MTDSQPKTRQEVAPVSAVVAMIKGQRGERGAPVATADEPANKPVALNPMLTKSIRHGTQPGPAPCQRRKGISPLARRLLAVEAEGTWIWSGREGLRPVYERIHAADVKSQ